jgi:sugar O-acyltransferase (sialic acid O-acetyltransferase NeuD family)
MKKILLIGGGGHCKSVIDVIEASKEYEIAGIVDHSDLLGQTILGYPIIGADEDLEELRTKFEYAIVTVGQVRSNLIRVRLFSLLLDLGYILPNIVSPLAYVSRHVEMGQGNVVMHYAMINSACIVGDNCIFNSKSLVEHDCEIGDHCHVSTASVLNGNTKVVANSFVGSNSTSREGIELSGFIKAGSLNL